MKTNFEPRETLCILNNKVIPDSRIITKFNSALVNISKHINSYFPPETETANNPTVTCRIKPKKSYPSGSSYEGEWGYVSSWNGKGQYIFPHGVIYDGEFTNTEFNGDGIMRYPMGQTVKCKWKNGKTTSWQYCFKDGLEYHSPWKYCVFPDRRFQSTIEAGCFLPPGQERITDSKRPRPIPPGCFDAGEGIYDPRLFALLDPCDFNKVVRIAYNTTESEWIVRNCRSHKQGTVGYRPELYEYWCSGTAASVNHIQQDIAARKLAESEGEAGESGK